MEEYFDVFRCQCDAWSSLGQTSSRAATVATGCKFVAMMDMIKILKESVKGLVVPKCLARSYFVAELIMLLIHLLCAKTKKQLFARTNSFFPDLNKEFEVPPYSQSVTLGSQVSG